MTQIDSMSNKIPASEEAASKHQYRSALGIISEILHACMDAGSEGIRVSKISQKANMSHSVVKYHCKKLVDADMIKTQKTDRKHMFMITEKGIRFVDELGRFHNMVKEINLRY